MIVESFNLKIRYKCCGLQPVSYKTEKYRSWLKVFGHVVKNIRSLRYHLFSSTHIEFRSNELC